MLRDDTKMPQTGTISISTVWEYHGIQLAAILTQRNGLPKAD